MLFPGWMHYHFELNKSSASFLSFFCFFKESGEGRLFKLYFERARERARAGEEQRKRERERERIPSRLCAVSAEPDMELELMIFEIMT